MNNLEKNNKIELPTLSKRVSAMFIDVVILVFIFYLSSYIFHLTDSNNETIKIIIYFGMTMLYEPIFISLFSCTAGQFIVNLRVKRNNVHTKRINILLAILRFLVKYFLGWLSFLTVSFNENKRAIHDLASGSIVVFATQENTKYQFNRIFAFTKNKWWKLIFALVIFILWCIWAGNYWLFFGIPIFYDIYISKKVNWAFWKKRVKEGKKRKKGKVVEWVDALVFAIIAATLIRTFFIEAFTIPTSSMEKSLLVGDYLFVSKVSYGPRLPNTPLSFPFVHHTMPTTESTPSYLEWIKMPYKRIAGLGEVERYDGLVFNFPTGDTVVVGRSNQGYYDIIRIRAMELKQQDNMHGDSSKTWDLYLKNARKQIWNQYDIIIRPTDKTDNYIKRCVGLPGDTLEIQAGQLLINGEKQKHFKGRQYNYLVFTNGTRINPKSIRKLGISDDEDQNTKNFMYDINAINLIQSDSTLLQTDINDIYQYPLTDENAKKISGYANVKKVIKLVDPKGAKNFRIFPHSDNYSWNEDWFGPMLVPEKGLTIKINTFNIPLYERIIGYYEKNKLEIKGNDIFINGEKADEYTFKMDYYWLMGDNRHGSADSRFWGFVPDDHVVGKAVFIWLSLDKDKGWFEGKIRWNRMFKLVNSLG